MYSDKPRVIYKWYLLQEMYRERKISIIKINITSNSFFNWMLKCDNIIYIPIINLKTLGDSWYQNSKFRENYYFPYCVFNFCTIFFYFLQLKSNYRLVQKDKDVSFSTCLSNWYIFSDVWIDEKTELIRYSQDVRCLRNYIIWYYIVHDAWFYF